MNEQFAKIKAISMANGYVITKELPEKGVIVIQKTKQNLENIVLGINPPILILEMLVFTIKSNHEIVFKKLLQKNRDMIHGAFVLDKSGKNIIYRDTLQLENLDENEITGTLNALELLMEEYLEEIQAFSRY